MTVIRPGKGDKRTISKGKEGHYRVTKSREEKSRKNPLKINKNLLKIKDPFKM